MKLFDAHCHLQDDRLAPKLDDAIQRAQEAGVKHMVCCGTCEGDWPRIKELAQKYNSVFPAFGLHPWFIKERTKDWQENLERFLAETSSAVGEIGLDHAIEDRDDPDQESVFIAQMELAARLNRPATIHCRRAWDRFPVLLKEMRNRPTRFMVHSYSGGTELMHPLAELGAYFSFSGSITLTNNRKGLKSVAACPADRLLLETDAPDIPPLLPDGTRAEMSEPANLPLALRAAAAARGVSEVDLAAQVWENSCRFYGFEL
ncbi:MAG: TatD family hydrolase [Kiritimatiellia bacterium]